MHIIWSAVLKYVLQSSSHDHGDKGSILSFSSLLLWFYEPSPGQQVILIVCEATSGTALTSVTNLKAALEVANTKSL